MNQNSTAPFKGLIWEKLYRVKNLAVLNKDITIFYHYFTFFILYNPNLIQIKS